MSELEVRRTIAAAPESVWRIVTDLDGAVDVLSAVTRIERLDGGGEMAVGTRWRETRTMFGRSATEQMTVTQLDPGRSYTVTASSNGVDYTSGMSVAPVAGGTELTFSFAAQPTSLLSRLMSATMGWMFASATRKAVEKDLADIAAAAEGGSQTD